MLSAPRGLKTCYKVRLPTHLTCQRLFKSAMNFASHLVRQEKGLTASSRDSHEASAGAHESAAMLSAPRGLKTCYKVRLPTHLTCQRLFLKRFILHI
jgi:hypothetical protein